MLLTHFRRKWVVRLQKFAFMTYEFLVGNKHPVIPGLRKFLVKSRKKKRNFYYAKKIVIYMKSIHLIQCKKVIIRVIAVRGSFKMFSVPFLTFRFGGWWLRGG